MSNKKQDVQRDLKGEERKKIIDMNVSWHTTVNVLVFLGLLALTGMETYKCLIRLMEAPTYTSFRLAAQKETDFPSLTICPVVTEAFRDNKLMVNLYTKFKISFIFSSYLMIMIVNNSIFIIRNMVSNTKSTKIDSGIDLAKELDGRVEQKISQKHSFSTILLTNSRT